MCVVWNFSCQVWIIWGINFFDLFFWLLKKKHYRFFFFKESAVISLWLFGWRGRWGRRGSLASSSILALITFPLLSPIAFSHLHSELDLFLGTFASRERERSDQGDASSSAQSTGPPGWSLLSSSRVLLVKTCTSAWAGLKIWLFSGRSRKIGLRMN